MSWWLGLLLAAAQLGGVQSEGSCSAEHIAEAVREASPCQPRPVVVRLPWPNNTEVHQMTPTHVQVSTNAELKALLHRLGRAE